MATPVKAGSPVKGLVLGHPHATFNASAVAGQAEHKADQGDEAIGFDPGQGPFARSKGGLARRAMTPKTPMITISEVSLPLNVAIGKAAVLQEGKDISIIASSMKVIEASAAAAMLAKDGIHAGVIDLRTLRPLDLAAIKASHRQDPSRRGERWKGHLPAATR